jgi:hypothetical protein
VVEKTLKLFECDVDGAEGQRYTVTFPDGSQLHLDRCDRHNAKLEKLRDEKGTWATKSRGQRSSFKISSLEDIERQRGSE